MPSEDLRRRALELLHERRDRFRSALATTIEEVRAFLATHEGSAEDHARGESAALGQFASGRVDPERFTALLSQTLTIDAPAAAQIRRALGALQVLAGRLEALGAVTVEPGGSLRDAVAGVLTEIGCAFGAAHVVAAVRSGHYDEAEHGGLLKAFPFRRWSAAERQLAPPLVVEVAGRDLQAAGLGEFLDGGVAFVLLVDGRCPPAPLARLITPGTYVLQTSEVGDVAALAGFEGPAVAAVLPPEAAHFRHDPTGGDAPCERLTIQRLPEEAPRRAVGGISAAQQADDLALLRQWTQAGAPAAGGGPATTSAHATPADRLAAWLLGQADLKDLD